MKNTHNFSASLVMPQKARIWGSILMGAALWGILGDEAKAQTPNPETAPAFSPPTNEKRAIDLFDKGMAAKKQNDWVSARDFFKQSLEAWPHWKTAANLGETELQLGRARDAAEHLDWALWELTKSREDAAALSAVQAKLDEAKLKAVTITLVTKDGGVDLYVDGKYIGKSPLARPVYVEAGTRVFEGKKANGEVAREEGVFGFGMAREVRLEGFGKVGESVGNIKAISQGGNAKPAWYPWALIGGGALAALGTGMGIGFTAMANGASKEAHTVRDNMFEKAGRLGKSDLEHLCADTRFQADCNNLNDLRQRWDRNEGIAIGSFIAGGLFAGGTIWIFRSKVSGPHKASVVASIAPMVGSRYQGIQLGGAF